MNLRPVLLAGSGALLGVVAIASPACAQVAGARPTPGADQQTPASQTGANPSTIGDNSAAAGGDAPGSGLAEIVVTAQRRSENLQKVPIAVTVATAAQLTAVSVNSAQDLKLVAPSVDVQTTTGYVSPFIRGIGTRAFGPGFENPIAIYVDDVYLASAATGLFTFNNISQVEVLEGPQGTLFGRNATGGLIHVRTRDPSSEFGGSIRAGYGNYNTGRFNAYVTDGIADGVKADLAVQGVWQGDGYGKNVVTGHDVYKINHDISARSKWLIDLGGHTTVRLIGDYSDSSNYNVIYSVIPGAGVPPPYAAPPATLGPYDTALNLNPILRTKDGGGSVRIDSALGGVRIASISAYRRDKYFNSLDIDVSPSLGRSAFISQADHQFSQELQLLSSTSSAFTWVVGAFFFDAKSQYEPSDVHFDGVAVVPIPTFPREVTTLSSQKTVSIAGYGQGSFKVTDTLNLTGGLRYTSEKRILQGDVVTNFNNGATAITAGPLDNHVTFSKLTWRLSVDYSPVNDVLVYASYNRGFKSGGFSTANLTFPPYQPEVLDAYEVGLKASPFDRRVRLKTAFFYYDYKNVQIQRLLVGVPAVINSAAETLYGFEANVEAKLGSQLTGSVGYQYLHGRYDSFPTAVITTPNPAGGAIIALGSASGHTTAQTPTSTATAALTYSLPVGDAGKIDATGNIYYNSGYFGEPDNVLRQPAYTLIGASIRYKLDGSGVAFSVWGSNLTDRKVSNLLATTPGAGVTGIYRRTLSPPRTFGGTVEYTW